eukprot:127937-Hanusia_phi.AAC.4
MAAVSQSCTNPDETTEGNTNVRPLAEKSSYYYAHNQVRSDSPKTLVGATEIYNHKALDAEQVAQLEKQASQTLESGQIQNQVRSASSYTDLREGHSSWNKGGTWEEKDYTKWAEQRLKELLPKINSPKGLITFKDVGVHQLPPPALTAGLRSERVFSWEEEVGDRDRKDQVGVEGGGRRSEGKVGDH